MALLRRPAGARRRNPALVAAVLLVLAMVALDYLIGLATDSVEVVDRSSGRIAAGTLRACGVTMPLTRVLLSRRSWRVTPPRLCAGDTTLTLHLGDGSVNTCTGFHVTAGHDWRVVVTDTGCGGFKPATLPAW